MSEQENVRPEESEAPADPNDTASDSQAETATAEPADAKPTETNTDAETGAQPSDRPDDQEAARERELLERIAALEAENSDLKNQYLRKQADVENYRKRMLRDKEDAVSYANQQLLLDLTAIIDDFERAISSAEESRDYDAFHDGIVLIEKQLTGMLERKWGLKRIVSEGQEFDPQKHEAVTTEPRSEDSTSQVLEEYQGGYMLHDRVLRSAKVKVSMPGTD